MTLFLILSALLVAAILVYLFSKSKGKLHCVVESGLTIKSEKVKAVYALFQTFFVGEYKSEAEFLEYLRTPEDLLLFYDESEELIGFIILRKSSYTIENQFFRVVEGDFFGLKKEYRRNFLPLYCLMKYCLLHKLRHPFTPMYYFFLTYSYRSYLSFGRTVGDYWPRHSAATPRLPQLILNMLGKKNEGEWGIYNEQTCVIADKTKGERGRLAITLSEPTAVTKTIEFFFKLDPGYRQGDCLCVLCNISWLTVATGIFNIFNRWRHRTSQAPLRPVAYGRARNGMDERPIGQFEEFKVEVGPLNQSFLQDKLKMALRSEFPISDDSDYLRELLVYWEKEFDWESIESWLNSFPQYRYKTRDNTWLHFVHYQSSRQGAIPLLLVHGFPSSIIEFYKVIHLLANPEDDNDPAFHVVCVSLPGCGWSESLASSTTSSRRAGNEEASSLGKEEDKDTAENIALLLSDLMLSMDYMLFAAQGTGPLAARVVSHLAKQFPANCLALHLGTPIPESQRRTTWWSRMKTSVMLGLPNLFFNKQEVEQLRRYRKQQYESISSVDLKWSYAVGSDPLALAAFFIARMREATDCKGNVENVFNKEEMLTWIASYWFSGSVNSAIALYHANSPVQGRCNLLSSGPIDVPVGITVYPKQQTLPKYFCQKFYPKIKYWKYMKKGGYFPAWEDPIGFVEDVRNFFSVVRSPTPPTLKKKK